MMEEQWKDIEGYEGIYQVSNLGRVRSLDRTYTMKNGRKQSQKGRFMIARVDKDGYEIIKLRTLTSRVAHRVHRLVAQAFIPNPDNLALINHKDENKTNNRADNLEWCTNSYNLSYGSCLEKMSSSHRNRHYLSKPIEQYTADGQFVKAYPSSAEAMRQTGIHKNNIRACCRGLYSQSGGFIWKEKKD